MPTRLQLAEHLRTEELEERYRAATRSTEAKRLQVIWLLSKGWHTEDIAEAVGYTVIWVRKLAGRYNEGGPEAMLDGRRSNPGQERLLDEEGCAALLHALQREIPPGGGQWNGPKVATWMSRRLGRTLDPARGWEYLRYLDYTPQRPRPQHEKAADREAQEEYKRRPRATRA